MQYNNSDNQAINKEHINNNLSTKDLFSCNINSELKRINTKYHRFWSKQKNNKINIQNNNLDGSIHNDKNMVLNSNNKIK